jgi:hypothetical protein
MPGGPYKRIPYHGFLAPVNKSGNLIGSITASFKEFLAVSNPDISFQETLGLSVTIA